MKRFLVLPLTVFVLFIAIVAAFAQPRGLGVPKSVIPRDGFVPTEAVATAIAEVVLIPVYGKQQVASELPLKAKLSADIWTVTGSVKCDGPPGSICPGGAAEVRISKRTGQILFMTHYQ